MSKGITSVDGLNPGDLFTTDGRDVWELTSYCVHPTATVKNLRTGEERSGAVGSLILGDMIALKPVTPPPPIHVEPVPWATSEDAQ